MKAKKIIKRVITEVFELTKMFLFAVAFSVFLKNTVIASANVPTGSMEETIMTGSNIMINRLAYIAGEPQRGDIVAFYCPDSPEELFLKRVMGLPEETIAGIDGYVYIDGVKLEQDYTPQILWNDFGPFTIPEGHYFMMGDNRNNSWDSRYWQNTFVPKEDIIGKAMFEFYPEFKIFN